MRLSRETVRRRYSGVVALVPVYEAGVGDVTEVYFEEGMRTEPLKISSVVKRICAGRFIDYEELRLCVHEASGIRNMIPILLEEDVLIPFKVRKPLTKNDRSFGYFSLAGMKEFTEGETGLVIRMENGMVLHALCSRATLEKHIRASKLAWYSYGRERSPRKSEKKACFF